MFNSGRESHELYKDRATLSASIQGKCLNASKKQDLLTLLKHPNFLPRLSRGLGSISFVCDASVSFVLCLPINLFLFVKALHVFFGLLAWLSPWHVTDKPFAEMWFYLHILIRINLRCIGISVWRSLKCKCCRISIYLLL